MVNIAIKTEIIINKDKIDLRKNTDILPPKKKGERNKKISPLQTF
jgi:hypothetical protein